MDRVPGRKTNPANKKASQIPGPITAAANDGRTNKPEPILAATVTMINPTNVNDLLMVDFTSATTPEISPFSSLSVVDLMSTQTSPDVYNLARYTIFNAVIPR